MHHRVEEVDHRVIILREVVNNSIQFSVVVQERQRNVEIFLSKEVVRHTIIWLNSPSKEVEVEEEVAEEITTSKPL